MKVPSNNDQEDNEGNDVPAANVNRDPIGAARDLWPLAQNAGYESGFDSEESDDSEYTLGSSEDDEQQG
ncbi:unnamed protein product, partial [Mesorhabditis belari]|uniref:Uncharacterized protein n=1 Tax=Mesorhabditis belari TaxID=2138241 RepID=A0AAF3FAF0_9BILA